MPSSSVTCLSSFRLTRKNSFRLLTLFTCLSTNRRCRAVSSAGASSELSMACTSKGKGTLASPSSLTLSVGSSLRVSPIL